MDKPRAAGARVQCVACGAHASGKGGKVFKCVRCKNHSFEGKRAQTKFVATKTPVKTFGSVEIVPLS